MSSPKKRSAINSPSRREATAGEYFSPSVSGRRLVLSLIHIFAAAVDAGRIEDAKLPDELAGALKAVEDIR